MPMILHLCNDFAGSTVHAELYQRLEQIGARQIVYCPIRDSELEGNNSFEGNNSEIIYSNILKKYHRFCFHLKIKDIVRDIERRIDLSKVDCVHATTLFSDGAVALKLKQKYGIPFIVAVRNTDLNAFMKYAPHLWNVHRRVVREAEKVVFITPNIEKRFISHHTLKGLTEIVEQKAIVIPNGLNDFWHNNLSLENDETDNPFSIVYVGKFDDNKNVLRLIRAFLKLAEKYPEKPFHLDLVGGDGEQEKSVLQLVTKKSEIMHYHGKIFDKPLLMNIYRRNRVFAMPSKKETFGLVYLEAMSQGLAVLYTRGEGIDGLFDARVGEAVNAFSEDEICVALERMLLRPDEYVKLQTSDFEKFQWKKIAQQYLDIYQKLIRHP